MEWDATDGRNEGAERTARETLLDMASFDYGAGERDPGARVLTQV